jgi:hypothetical protein
MDEEDEGEEEEEEEDEEGDEFDESESEEAPAPAPPAKKAAAAVTPGKRPAEQQLLSPVAKKAAATPAKTPQAKAPAAAATPAKTPAAAKAPAGAAKTPAATPAGLKTPAGAKTPGGSKAPVTPAADKGVATPGSAVEFEAQLVAFLRDNGRTGLSALGGKVKKPASVPKLMTYLKERPAVFRVTGDQIELVK